MRRRMAALTALCLTGTLVLSGGWSQIAMASAVSENAEDAAPETAAEAQTADQSDSADNSGNTDSTDHTERSDAADAPEEQPDGTDHSDASQNADESGQTDESQATDGAGGTDQPQDAQTPEAEKSQNPQTDETTDDQEGMPDEDEAEDPALLEQQEEEQPVARYEGITIDGDFSDWDAVAKTPVNRGGTLSEVAMVWDGDYVYLYFKENAQNWNAITWDGAYSNGQFAITTDMGRSVLVRLSHRNNSEPCVNGVDGARVAVDSTAWGQDSYQWEVSIPSSELPKYKQTISFGLYQGETFIQNVANLQGDPDADNKNFSGITYDGLYGDWDYYPHVLLNYATPGTQEKVVDADGAMYASDGKLYAHVVTNMPQHLQEAGGEFTYAVTIRVNKDKDFAPRFVTVDAAGNINYNPQLSGLAYGTYEYCIIDRGYGGTAKTEAELQADGDLYGHMYVTVSPSEDNMEYEVDLTTLAAKFGMEPDNIETLHGQWGRIGQQWVTTAGTPTGAGMGLFLCLSTTGIAYLAQRKRKKQV